MKYVEQVKSIILTFLVGLSLILTFSIWSYTPPYQVIEESQVEQITVGEHKTLEKVIQPYRILLSNEQQFSGTISSTLIDNIMTTLSNVRATELNFIQSNLSNEKVNSMIGANNRITLFFAAEVPINTFKSIVEFTQSELPEISFSHLIIDWSKFNQSNTLQLLFVSEQNRTLYTTDIALSNDYFNSTFNDVFKHAIAFEEVKRNNELSLYVPSNSVELMKYTYFIDEVSPERFKEILFKDTNIVKKTIESATSSKYNDGMSFMTLDTKTRIINYVYPTSESINDIKGSTLLQESFDFLNEHGGLTGDYRYVYRNIPKHITEYQLFLQGVPVFSNITSTRIATTWGDNQIFSYRRPYYKLDMAIPSEKVIRQLPSGVQISEWIEDIHEVDELMIGYYLTGSEIDDKLYTLEPSWFAIRDGSWTRITPSLGGVGYGLE
ncbi:regulatory protein YycH of two-component signal transduction system YycFG [Ureibacillus xyleni]|uniref:Regulatory protein YycH of two-component signal transduction system YycFG n=1 Tax=Ureibacillus xyleni TaxID=614648 RepID=A0A285SQD0_9BACL|nr:two-component system activity regulator YycH [Ureibacillus xyleni]SOC08203.1 regulatory protein YycH of two-component signal transduction system YycFG [Ureibacillus xyleni]